MKDLRTELSARDQVANEIRMKILHGELAAGQKISEREVSEALHVSTTPVKEAFRILETEGLIETLPRKGSFVSEFSRENTLQITFIRSSLEGLIAYFAAQAISDEELDAIDQIMDEAYHFIKQDNEEELENRNALFHEIIRGACDNRYLSHQVESMRSVDHSIRVIATKNTEVERMRQHFEHRQIAAALREHDANEAERLMVDHIRRVAKESIKNHT